jgi:hypothetical protein
MSNYGITCGLTYLAGAQRMHTHAAAAHAAPLRHTDSHSAYTPGRITCHTSNNIGIQ